MEELLQWIEYIRQERKVRHLLKDILVIVLFATLANADDWVEIALFAEWNQDYLKKYIELKNGPPSHDTVRRVMGMLSPEVLQQLYGKWQGLLNRSEGEVLKKLICIDGKTMRGNKKGKERPSHIVSAWSKEDGFCLGQKLLRKKVMRLKRYRDCWIIYRSRGRSLQLMQWGLRQQLQKRYGINAQTMCLH